MRSKPNHGRNMNESLEREIVARENQYVSQFMSEPRPISIQDQYATESEELNREINRLKDKERDRIALMSSNAQLKRDHDEVTNLYNEAKPQLVSKTNTIQELEANKATSEICQSTLT